MKWRSTSSTRSATNWRASRPSTAWRSPSIPGPNMPGGAFEIERTQTRDPGERPAPSAVSIEAGFVPSSEPEPDYVEEVDDEEEFVDTEPKHGEDEREERAPRDKRERKEGERGDRDGGRKRRRRGGRGRAADADVARAPTCRRPASLSQAEAVAPEASSGDRSQVPKRRCPGRPAQRPAAARREWRAARRKRRRRRGRRGGRDRADRPQGDGTAADGRPQAGLQRADRFGAVPDEIDTTPNRRAVGTRCAVGAGAGR